MLLPKPQKSERKRAGIDTSELALPRPRAHRNKPYMAYVREHGCAVKGRGDTRCLMPIDAAHIENTGMAIKGSDLSTINLCRAHHMQQHSLGWGRFEERYGINRYEIAFHLLRTWHERTS